METPVVAPPNTFYRVSLKAVIKDAEGRILVVKEDSDTWSLPGGGWDHGESEHDALARELREEVGFTGDFTSKIIATEPRWMSHRQVWLLWLVYDIGIDNLNKDDFTVGADADEIAWMYPAEFEHANTKAGQWIYGNLT